MTESTNILHREENLVSLRTVLITDDGHMVSFFLLPRLDSPILNDPDCFKTGHTFLYRHKKSILAQIRRPRLGSISRDLLRLSLLHHADKGFRKWVGYFGYRDILVSQEKDVRAMTFDKPPELKLLWADTGHSVALTLNGEPWAFVHQDSKEGYSKGILRPTVGNPWDQALFKKTFAIK